MEQLYSTSRYSVGQLVTIRSCTEYLGRLGIRPTRTKCLTHDGGSPHGEWRETLSHPFHLAACQSAWGTGLATVQIQVFRPNQPPQCASACAAPVQISSAGSEKLRGTVPLCCSAVPGLRSESASAAPLGLRLMLTAPRRASSGQTAPTLLVCQLARAVCPSLRRDDQGCVRRRVIVVLCSWTNGPLRVWRVESTISASGIWPAPAIRSTQSLTDRLAPAGCCSVLSIHTGRGALRRHSFRAAVALPAFADRLDRLDRLLLLPPAELPPP